VKKLAITSSIAAAILALASAAGHAQVPPMPQVPGALPASIRERLLKRRTALASELEALQSKGAAFNAKCATVASDSPMVQECASEQTQLEGERRHYIAGVAAFKNAIGKALGPYGLAAIESMSGKVERRMPNGGFARMPANAVLHAGDEIATGSDGHVVLLLVGGEYEFGPNETFLYKPEPGKNILGFRITIDNGREVDEPVACPGVRG